MKMTKENVNRVLKTNSRTTRTFIHHLMKAQYAVISQSYLEYYGNILLDLDTSIKRINTQPITTAIPFMEKIRDVTPDTLVLTNHEEFELIEWKEEKLYLERKAHYDHIQNQYESTGIVKYKVLTEEYVWQQPRLKNSLAIHRIAMSSNPTTTEVTLIRNIIGDGTKTLGHTENELKKNHVHTYALWWLIGRQFIEIDRTEIFSKQSILKWSDTYEI